jgi:hypothetical protein
VKASSAIWLALRLATVSALSCSFGDGVGGDLGEVGRQLAEHAALEFLGQLGMRGLVGVELVVHSASALAPASFAFQAA